MAALTAIRRRRYSLRRVVPPLVIAGTLTALLGVGLVGCGSDTTGPAPVSATQLYWALHFDWPAVNLALDNAAHDTAQLTATPVTQADAPIPGASAVQYHAADSNVTVSPTGLVTAHYITNRTFVTASLTLNGVTHVDTAWIRVTQTPLFSSPLATLSIQPHPDELDSAKIALFRDGQINQWNGNIPVYATDVAGDSLCDVNAFDLACPFLVSFASSNPRIATLDPDGYLSTNAPGHVTFTVSTLAYGVGLRDSLPFVIGYPLGATFLVYPGGSPSAVVPVLSKPTVTIGVGGVAVLANNNTGQLLEITLPYQTPMVHRVYTDKPSTQMTDTVAAGSSGNQLMNVRFDSAGTYTVHMTLLGSGKTTTGTIIVDSGP